MLRIELLEIYARSVTATYATNRDRRDVGRDRRRPAELHPSSARSSTNAVTVAMHPRVFVSCTYEYSVGAEEPQGNSVPRATCISVRTTRRTALASTTDVARLAIVRRSSADRLVNAPCTYSRSNAFVKLIFS